MIDFAEANGLSDRRLGRMLRGEVVMRLEDIAAAERILELKRAWELTLQSDLMEMKRQSDERRHLID